MPHVHERHFLAFTKKERRGIFALLALLVCIYCTARFVYPHFTEPEPVGQQYLAEAERKFASRANYPRDSNYRNTNAYQTKGYQRSGYLKENEDLTKALFNFDPNTISEAQWISLGAKPRTAASIQKYLSKGGKFRKPVDILKIWGLSDELKARLLPFVVIAEGGRQTADKRAQFEKRELFSKPAILVDVNTADTLAFDGLRGIGAGYARRIVKFRDKLGGFYSVDQVAETFGLPDSVFQKIKPQLRISGEVKKININTASEDELKAHPYIRWQLAKTIAAFRKQHGAFISGTDLLKIGSIDEIAVKKLLPYLNFAP